MPRRPLPDGLEGGRTVELANRLNSAAIHLLRRISRQDGVDGVPPARLSALSVLVFGGPMTVSALARRERVATPTMTRTVDALVRDGLVVRNPVPGDRRASLLTVTDRGRDLLERGRARRIEGLAGELAAVTPERLDVIEAALDVLEHLEVTPSSLASPLPSPEASR
jgi:DNA-binding MarR family transcriptional regulator